MKVNQANGGCRRVSPQATQTGGSNRQESSLPATHQDGSNRQESSLPATHQDGSNRQESSLRATHTGGSNRQCNDGSNRHKTNRTGGWSKTLKVLILAALIQVSWGMQDQVSRTNQPSNDMDEKQSNQIGSDVLKAVKEMQETNQQMMEKLDKKSSKPYTIDAGTIDAGKMPQYPILHALFENGERHNL